jgi:putative oxidoreductase
MAENSQTRAQTDTMMSKIKMIGFWALKILIAVLFIAAGLAKISGQPMMVDEFGKVGLGQWFRYFTGAVEICGAVLVLWPKSSPFGALLLACVCVGAFVAQATVLHGDVIHTLVLLLITLAVAWVQRARLPFFNPKPAFG